CPPRRPRSPPANPCPRCSWGSIVMGNYPFVNGSSSGTHDFLRADQQIRQARHMDRTSATSRSIFARVLLTSAFDWSVPHTNACLLLSSATFFLKYAATL